MTDYLRSAVSIISTGPNNFGHPNRTTLDTLRHTKIYRTDINNSIKISTSGYLYNINTYNRTTKKYQRIEELKPVN